MKTENFIVGLVVVGAVAFFLGRLSVSTKERPAESKEEAAKTTPKQTQEQPATAATAQPAAAPTADMQGGAVKSAAVPATAQPAPVRAGEAGQPQAEVAKAVEARPATVQPTAPTAPVEVKQPTRIPSRPLVPGSTMVVESPFKGPQDAKVTIIEISDFQ